MRALVLILGMTVHAGADPARWRQATAPTLVQVAAIDDQLYGVGPEGVHRSSDGGKTWSVVDPGAANAIWGSALDDVWVVRDRSLHHTIDGVAWTSQVIASGFGVKLEGIWGLEAERYAFGADRAAGRAVVLHSRDRGRTWSRESIGQARVTGVWGRSPRDLYAVGPDGLAHSTGDGRWRLVRREPLRAIAGTRTAIYAVGDRGVILAFDGRAWTRRASNVSYPLSSIAEIAGELYAGSQEGPPLRSTDGVTWRPITAVVARGDVAGGSTLVITGDTVHYLDRGRRYAGELPASLQGLAARYGGSPAIDELLQDIAYHLDPRFGQPATHPTSPAPELDSQRGRALAAAVTERDRLAANARYVLDGGQDPSARHAIARALDRWVTWEGLFWNGPSPPPPPRCEPDLVERTTGLAEDAFDGGDYARAYEHYSKVWPCEPRLLSRAYAAACKAKQFTAARTLFQALARPGLAALCVREGFDPR